MYLRKMTAKNCQQWQKSTVHESPIALEVILIFRDSIKPNPYQSNILTKGGQGLGFRSQKIDSTSLCLSAWVQKHSEIEIILTEGEKKAIAAIGSKGESFCSLENLGGTEP